MGRRDSIFGQLGQGEDLSSLTNYDERSVKPIEGATESKPQDPLFSSFTPSSQQYSYSSQGAQSAPSYAPPATSPTPLFSGRTDAAKPYYEQSGETPMVFALRSEPGSYVYEYADRLEIYKHSLISGMTLEKTILKRR
ncbi:MAG: hypothetical protein J1F39_05435 [Clostridiales bacterium]|nr:hypothetical protein [Clostridiales bacterium]